MTLATEWMPRERWDALVRGEGCPLCAELASDEADNKHGHRVADLTRSRPRLAANQWAPGYCILICADHVREPFELNADDRAALAIAEDVFQQIVSLRYASDPAAKRFSGDAVKPGAPRRRRGVDR